MGKTSWERARQRSVGYSRRRPEDTPPYRIVFHYHEELERCWSDVFEPKYGALRDEVREAFLAYLNCGILFCGAARAYCANCRHSQLIAYSCKRRGLCPSCEAKRGVIFAEHLHEHVLLPYPHRHLTFSIPKRLRIYFKFNRKLTKLLYHAAWSTWREIIEDILPGGKSGMVASLHSAGDLLNFHPHIHALVLDGAIDDSDAFRQLPEFESAKLEAAFERRVLSVMVESELITEEVAVNIASWEHSGFHVHIGEPIAADDVDLRRFLSRYLKKAPLSLERLEIIDSPLGTTVQVFKHCDDGDVTRELSPLEFLAELSCHIPDVWEQTSRYFGCYAARTRGKARKLRESVGAAVLPPPSAEEKKASRTWAACMKRIYEIDPLACPKCGAQMKIIAFLHNSREITNICNSLGITPWRAPPPFASASRTVLAA